MRGNFTSFLRDRLRDAVPTARVIVEARVEANADVRSVPGTAFGTPLGWSDADNWGSIYPSAVEILSDGSLRLKAVAGGAVGPSTQNAAYRPFELGGSIPTPYLDPIPTVANGPANFPANSSFAGMLVQWTGVSTPVSYGSFQAYLNPQYDSTKDLFVHTWVLHIWRAISNPAVVDPASGQQVWTLTHELCITRDIPSQSAGLVVFTPDKGAEWTPGLWDPIAQQGAQYWIQIYGKDSQGQPATNCGWGYDNAHTTYSWGSQVNAQGHAVQQLSEPTILSGVGGTVEDAGVIDIPYFQFVPAAFSGSTPITWATSPGTVFTPNGGSSPATYPEFVLKGAVPVNPGTALQLQARPHGVGSYVNVDDGTNTGLPSYAFAGHALDPTWDVQAILTASTDGSQSPILQSLGMRTVVIADLGDLAEVTSWSERFDPLTHVAEIPQVTIEVRKTGERDFRDVITKLLSQNPYAQLTFRVWVGDRSLPKKQWLLMNDFFPDEHDPRSSSVNIIGIGVNALLRQALPKLAADVPSYPVADDSNPGGFTVVGGAGATLYQALADIAVGGPFGNPKDSTYIQKVNPNSSQYSCKLLSVSPPSQAISNMVFIQVRAALGAAGSATAKAELYQGHPFSGGTLIATSQTATITTVDAGEGSYQAFQYGLLASEVNNVTDWTNLYLRLTASVGAPFTGTMRFSWARLVITGLRAPLQYPSAATSAATVQTCAQDLLQNQLAIQERYLGAGYIDLSPAIGVTKIIQPAVGASTLLTQAKDELDALMYIAGYIAIASGGQIKFRPVYSTVTAPDPTSGLTTIIARPLSAPVRAIFPLGTITPLATSPGFRQRVPIFDIPWGYQQGVYSDSLSRPVGTAGYAGEQRGINQYTLTAFPAGLIDPEKRARDIVSRWIGTQAIASGLAQRHVQTFGLGMPEWRFLSEYQYPELELGDLVVVATTDFLMFDPIANRALFGQQYAPAIINGKWDPQGKEFSCWVQSPSSIIRGIATTNAPAYVIPTGDLVLNPGFESGLSFWGRPALAGSTLTLATTAPAPLKGNASALLTIGTGHNGFIYQKSDSTNNLADSVLAPAYLIPVRPGQIVQIAAIVYDNGTDAINTVRKVGLLQLAPGVAQPSSTGAEFVGILVWDGGTNTAVAQTGYYTIPPGVANVVVACYGANVTGAAPQAFFDEVHLDFVGPGDVPHI